MANEYFGVTIDNLRQALRYLYFGKDSDFTLAMKYILPMQANFFNPIDVESHDTYILVTYDEDDSINTDDTNEATSHTHKVARCCVRFVGAKAELWAKAFHHIRKRPENYKIWLGTCQASLMSYIGPTRPVGVDFFGKNVNTAFDIDFSLEYYESIDLTWFALGTVTLAQGTVY